MSAQVRKGNLSRAVRHTEMNQHSSRSHTILQVSVLKYFTHAYMYSVYMYASCVLYTCSCLSKNRKDRDRTENPESSLRHTYRLPPHEALGVLAKRILFAMSMSRAS